MINAEINIEFLGFSEPVKGRNWVDTFMEKYILPKLKFTDVTLSKIGEDVKREQERNLENGLSYKGGVVKPKKKKSKSGSNRIFYDTGALFRSVMQKTGKEYVEIFIGANRSQIAYWLATGTRYMPSRPFFGISEELKTKIYERLKAQVYGR